MNMQDLLQRLKELQELRYANLDTFEFIDKINLEIDNLISELKG